MAKARDTYKDWESDTESDSDGTDSDEDSSQAREWTGDLNRIYRNYVAMWRKDPAAKFPQLVKSFVMEDLVDQMCRVDPVFAQHFLGVFPTGSFYGGTRVARPTEFDIDFVLHFNGVWWQDRLPPGYLRPHPQTIRYPTLLGYQPPKFQTTFGWVTLTPEGTRNWFFRVCSAALESLSSSFMPRVPVIAQRGIKRIEIEKNGPAITLQITKNDGEVADVDLVPALVVINANKLHAFAIPKQHPKIPFAWRYSKPWEERRLLIKSGCAKKVVKLLKKFRDAQAAQHTSWKKMSSYYLHTVVLHTLKETRNISWNEQFIGNIFMKALERLHRFLENGEIPFYWDRGCNLLEFVEKSTIEKMRKRLGKVITNVESGKEEFSEYLMGDDEKIEEAIIQYRKFKETEERKARRKRMEGEREAKRRRKAKRK